MTVAQMEQTLIVTLDWKKDPRSKALPKAGQNVGFPSIKAFSLLAQDCYVEAPFLVWSPKDVLYRTSRLG